MKRNTNTIRETRSKRNEERGISKGKSKYWDKVLRGRQMYGPGCCAHRLDAEQMAAIRRRNRTEYRHESIAFRPGISDF